MIICTKCGQQADPREAFCRRCGAFLEWTGAPATPPDAPPPVAPAAPPRRVNAEPEPAGPPLVATLSAAGVRVEPGGQASVTVEVRNRGRTVDQLALEVRGPAAAWASADPARLNLMPDTSAVVTILFRPPRAPSVRAGAYPTDVAVTSREHLDASVVDRVDVEVMPFVVIETSLAPSVLRGIGATATRLLASNRGNAPVELTLGGEDPEMAFSFGINPPTLRLDPGAAADALVVVKPREPLQSGPDRTRPFRILVTAGDGSRHALGGTFVQTAVPAPPPPPDPAPTGPPLVATLSATSVRVEPGGQASVTVEVLNRGRADDQLSLEVRGAAAPWASVDPARLSLVPDARAVATVLFRPPRTAGMRPGRYPTDVAVTSRAHADASVVDRIDVEVARFVALEATLAPSILRGRREATSKLSVSNHGNAPVELSLGGDDPEAALQLSISPSRLRLEPGAAGAASVVVKTRTENRSRADLTRPFRVLATAGDGSRQAGEGTFIQEAPGGRRGWRSLALLVPLVIVALFLASIYEPGTQPPPGDGTPTQEPAPGADGAATEPDLVLTDIIVKPKPAGYGYDDDVIINTVARNNGGDCREGFIVRCSFTCDGSETYFSGMQVTNGLGANQEVTLGDDALLSLSSCSFQSQRQFSCSVDADGLVAESDESNNSRSEDLLTGR